MTNNTPEAVTRGNETTQAICKILYSKGYKVTVEERKNSGYGRKNPMTRLKFEELGASFLNYSMTEVEKKTSAWDRYPEFTNKLVVKFGNKQDHYGTRNYRFPEPKKGFDVNKLANAIIEYIDTYNAGVAREEERSKRYAKHAQAATDIREEFGYRANVKTTSYGVSLSFDSLSEEQARILLQAAKEAKILDV